MASCRREKGFTLLELMVTIVVLVILVSIAMPSLRGMAQRSALRGAGDGIEGVISAAKEESIKRDRPVWVAMKSGGGRFCGGATTTPRGGVSQAAAPASDVAVWATNLRDQQNVEVQSIAFGGGDSFGFDPRTGILMQPANSGGVVLKNGTYAMQVRVSPIGRVSLCAPSVGSTTSISGMEAC